MAPPNKKRNASTSGPRSGGGKKRPGEIEQGSVDTILRIIGGKYRGSKLSYEPFLKAGRRAGEGPEAVVTRPMKHRVREAIFNLVGTEAEGKHAVDLFAGTGALGLEALSRGAIAATFIERHLPTAEVVKQNIKALDVESVSELLLTSAFLWSKRDLPHLNKTEGKSPLVSRRDGGQADLLAEATVPWVVFISPPYDFFIDRSEEMLALINTIKEHAPDESMLVVEADERFDFEQLPGGIRPDRHSKGWDVRPYAPAVVGVWTKGVS